MAPPQPPGYYEYSPYEPYGRRHHETSPVVIVVAAVAVVLVALLLCGALMPPPARRRGCRGMRAEGVEGGDDANRSAAPLPERYHAAHFTQAPQAPQQQQQQQQQPFPEPEVAEAPHADDQPVRAAFATEDLPGISQGRASLMNYHDDSLYNADGEGAGTKDDSPVRAMFDRQMPEGTEYANGSFVTPEGEQVYTYDAVMRSQVESSGIMQRMDGMVVRTSQIRQRSMTPGMERHCQEMIRSSRQDTGFPVVRSMDWTTIEGLYEFCVPLERQSQASTRDDVMDAVQGVLDDHADDIEHSSMFRSSVDKVKNAADSDYLNAEKYTVEEAGFSSDNFGMQT